MRWHHTSRPDPRDDTVVNKESIAVSAGTTCVMTVVERRSRILKLKQVCITCMYAWFPHEVFRSSDGVFEIWQLSIYGSSYHPKIIISG